MSDLMNEEKMHFILDENFSKNAKLKVVGVGGAGGNALNRMKEMEISDVEFIGINTDALALENSLADIKIPIGKETTKNLGAGARPEIGRQSALEEREKTIMTMRFGIGGGKEYTQKEVADSLGISQSYISRLEKRIIEKIKREI